MAEILDMMESYKRKQKEKTKEKILLIYQLAEWIAEHIASKLDKEYHPSCPWDKYPKLFAEEKQLFEENKRKQEFEIFKENRIRYYEYKNHQRTSKE